MDLEIEYAPSILFLDLDGTVRYNKYGKTFINHPDDVAIYPEALALMWEWNGPIVAVTNQGGVGLGYMTDRECWDNLLATDDLCNGAFDYISVCMHRPDAGCICRKPRPGLIYKGIGALMAADALPIPFRSDACLMVGDRPEDEAAANAAGLPFLDAVTWRNSA